MEIRTKEFIHQLCTVVLPSTSSILDLLSQFSIHVNRYQLNILQLDPSLLDRIWFLIKPEILNSTKIETKNRLLHILYTFLSNIPWNSDTSLMDQKQIILFDIFQSIYSMRDDSNVDSHIKLQLLKLIFLPQQTNFFSMLFEILFQDIFTKVKQTQFSHLESTFATFSHFLTLFLQTFEVNALPLQYLDSHSSILTYMMESLSKVVILLINQQQFAICNLHCLDLLLQFATVPNTSTFYKQISVKFLVQYISLLSYVVSIPFFQQKCKLIIHEMIVHYSPCKTDQILSIVSDIASYSSQLTIHKGSLYILGSVWGSNTSTNLLPKSIQILLKLVNTHHDPIYMQVLLVLQRIVSLHQNSFSYDIWDSIIDLLDRFEPCLRKQANFEPLFPVLSELIELILQSLLQDRFQGDLILLFHMTICFESIIQESTLIQVLSKKFQILFHPAYPNWIEYVRKTCVHFFFKQARNNLKQFVLEHVISNLLHKYRDSLGDAMLDILIPFLRDYYLDASITMENSMQILSFILQLIMECNYNDELKFQELMRILNRAILSSSFEMVQLNAVKGMIHCFVTKMNQASCIMESVICFDYCIKLLPHSNETIRSTLLHDLFLNLSSNDSFFICHHTTPSNYLKVHPHATHVHQRTIALVLPINNLVETLLNRCLEEESVGIYEQLLQVWQHYLFNAYLLKSISMGRVCSSLTQTGIKRNAFLVQNPKLCYLYLQCLHLLLGYGQILNVHHKNKIIDGLLMILQAFFTKQESEPIICLTLHCYSMCLYIMKKEALEQLDQVLHLFIHLEQPISSHLILSSCFTVLHSITSIQTIQTNLQSVISFCLLYTSSSHYPLHIVLFAYRIVMSWCSQVSLSMRQSSIKQIVPTLYQHMHSHNCIIAQSVLDFLIRNSYLKSDQNYQMNDPLKKVFNNKEYRAWALGSSILTSQSGLFSYIILRYRRATGTIAWTMKLLNRVRQQQQQVSSEELQQEEEEILSQQHLVANSSVPNTVKQEKENPLFNTVDTQDLLSTTTTTTNSSFDSKLSLSPNLMEYEKFLSLFGNPNVKHGNSEEEELYSTSRSSLDFSMLEDLSQQLQQEAKIEPIHEKTEFIEKTLPKVSSKTSVTTATPPLKITTPVHSSAPSMSRTKSANQVVSPIMAPISITLDDKRPLMKQDAFEDLFFQNIEIKSARLTEMATPSLKSPLSQAKLPDLKRERALSDPKPMNEPQTSPQMEKKSGWKRSSSTKNMAVSTKSNSPNKDQQASPRVKMPTTTPSPFQPQQSQQVQQQFNTKDDIIHPNFPYLFLRNWVFLGDSNPVSLQTGPALTRALQVLDMVPHHETTTVALLYLSKGQVKKEDVYLKNHSGSLAYFRFLKSLGTIQSINSLDNIEFTGGLDKSEQLLDGKYMLSHKDDISHIVFHVATFMPTLPSDTKCNNKKKHLGNDYICIVYDENAHNQEEEEGYYLSGQFNFVYIIIQPLINNLNRVQIVVREDVKIQIAKFGPLEGTNIVPDAQLADLVKLTVIHADMVIHHYRKSIGQNVSNWEERVTQIKQIKERFAKKTANENLPQSSDTEFIQSFKDFFE